MVVPKGTVIIVTTHRRYKSYGASTGTKVTYDVVQDAIVNGRVIVQAGDSGEGEDLNANERKINFWTGETQGANLCISLDKIYSFCGSEIAMDFAHTEFRNKQGLFGGQKDVEISKGQRYQAQIERAQKICSIKADAAPLPIPSGAMEGDKS